LTVWNNVATASKRSIFPFGELFQQRLTYENSLDTCITLMENLVFSAIDKEDRVLAANFVLIALTTVSNDARRTYPHLYDCYRVF
jgi:hypothetical protein